MLPALDGLDAAQLREVVATCRFLAELVSGAVVTHNEKMRWQLLDWANAIESEIDPPQAVRPLGKRRRSRA
jgi:hypothetical protein